MRVASRFQVGMSEVKPVCVDSEDDIYISLNHNLRDSQRRTDRQRETDQVQEEAVFSTSLT